MYRSGTDRRRLRASERDGDSIPRRRRRPAPPTSTATRWSAPPTSSRRRSLTRTTLRPSMSTICLSIRSDRSRISSGRCWNLPMSMVAVRSLAPVVSSDSTDVQGTKMRRRSVFDDEAGDRRIATAEGHDEVVDLTHGLVVHVTYRPADRLAQVQHVPPRGRVRAHGWRTSRESRVALDRPSGCGPGVWPWRRPSGPWRRGYWVRCPPGTDPSDATSSGRPTACATVRADRRGPGRV